MNWQSAQTSYVTYINFININKLNHNRDIWLYFVDYEVTKMKISSNFTAMFEP